MFLNFKKDKEVLKYVTCENILEVAKRIDHDWCRSNMMGLLIETTRCYILKVTNVILDWILDKLLISWDTIMISIIIYFYKAQ